jgi:predicted nucleotidyltransferase
MDIEKLKKEIVERLKPLNPEKIILFGSYAYGIPNEDSDIDIFLITKKLDVEDERLITRRARKLIRDLIFKYNVGFDILSAYSEDIKSRRDYFFREEILKKGKILYEQDSSN